MFQSFGNLVSRAWPLLLGVWIVVLVVLIRIAPEWDTVAQGGQFSFLPPDASSIRGTELFKKAFPNEPLGSNIVLVFSREHGQLDEQDKAFVAEVVAPAIARIAEQRQSIVARTITPGEAEAGAFLISEDNQATLIVIELRPDFLERSSWPAIADLENLVERLRAEGKVPAGLELTLTGTALAGRYLIQAETTSVDKIHIWTIVLVIVLLLVIYRAPLPALIPLATVALAVEVSTAILSLLGERGFIELSLTTRVYVTVLTYGAGVDYCLFLTARYREELEHGAAPREALANALGKVGGTLTASAATVICGIAMLMFAKFGKYHIAGFAIPFSIFIVLCGALTFSPSLLRLAGRWAFWPHRFTVIDSAECAVGVWQTAAAPRSTRWSRLQLFFQRGMFHGMWEWIGRALLARPGVIWLFSVAALCPFAVIAALNYNGWDYGLAKDMPPGTPGTAGNQILQQHFTPGMTGPITVLVKDDTVDFRGREGNLLVGALTGKIYENREELHVADIRSVARPLGFSFVEEKIISRLDISQPGLEEEGREKANAFYVSGNGDLAGHITRLDLVSDRDPIAGESIEDLTRIEQTLRSALPAKLQSADLYFIGSTASLRDVRDVTSRDLKLLEALVPAIVLVILVLFLRNVMLSFYLILSVLFSYLATLGATMVLFWALDPAGFTGLDWKVPIFLFTILIAVGEDYNIFLMKRVCEEQEQHGPARGVTVALVKTGGIISSCGVIMAGTFAALLAGDLIEMKQLGFALAFGVLLDTLIVRPLLVPAFLLWLQRLRTRPKVEHVQVGEQVGSR